MRRHDDGCFAITESLGDAIVVEATNIAFRNQRLGKCRIVVMGVKNLASAFWVSVEVQIDAAKRPSSRLQAIVARVDIKTIP